MDTDWIEDFLHLAQTRSFSRSASERNVTQSTLSRRIQSLEAWIGADLVDRSTYPLNLTLAGKAFYEIARELTNQLHTIRDDLRGQKLGGDMLQIAIGHTLSLNFFPGWLKQIQEKYGKINARILSSNIHDSALALIEGSCDLLFCYYHPEIPIRLNSDQYHYIQLDTDLVVPVSAPNQQKDPIFALPGSAQHPVPTLGYGTVYFGRILELILSRAPQAYHLQYCYNSNLSDLLKKMAIEGHGLAWVPERLVRNELANGQLVHAGGS